MDGSASVLIDAVRYLEEDIQREQRRNSTCALTVQCCWDYSIKLLQPLITPLKSNVVTSITTVLL